MKHPISIQSVSANQPEWDSVRAIRYHVFVVEQRVDEAEEYDEYETTSQHILAFVEEIPAGTARWRKTDKGFKLERFAVLENQRGRGVGNALLSEVLQQVQKVRGTSDLVYLHAQVQAMPFYARHGFVPYGQEFDEAGIRHMAMKWQPES